jgi:hypothetical protein
MAQPFVAFIFAVGLYLLIAVARTYDKYSHHWCGIRRLLPVILLGRLPAVFVMAIIYHELTALGELGLPDKYAVPYYMVAGFVAEKITKHLLHSSDSFRHPALLVEDRIAQKKIEVMNRILAFSPDDQLSILRKVVATAERGTKKEKTKLTKILNVPNVRITEEVIIKIINEVGVGHAKRLEQFAPEINLSAVAMRV